MKKHLRLFVQKICVLMLCNLWFVCVAHSHEAYITQHKAQRITISIRSTVLNETRTVQIYSPQIYSPSSAKSPRQTYPVVYVLDGESLGGSTVSAMQFLTQSLSLPQMTEAFVVSISNTNRDRDMPVPQQFANTNGAQNFLRFLVEELVPVVNKRCAVNGLNVLIGHSQGGLFATFAGAQQPEIFPFILALDAPMTVDSSVLQRCKVALDNSCLLRYVSIETLYGWGNVFSTPENCPHNLQQKFLQQKLPDETHESMAHKGIYDGLKILFYDFLPTRSDLPLRDVQQYYERLSKEHRCTYTIPSSVLLAGVNQNIHQSKKQNALELLRYYEQIYGNTTASKALTAKANAITQAPDERVDFYLNHPPPSEEQVGVFSGTWKGIVYVPNGTNTEIEWSIKKRNNRYAMESRVMKSFTTVSDFLVVNEKNELVWGRKHNGGGIYLSIGKLSANGRTLTGTENLIGFQFPKGFPPFQQNTFHFQKLSEPQTQE